MSASKRRVSDYLEQGPGAFFFHKEALAESNYDYTAFMHRSGNTYIMRENLTTGEITYGDGGFKLSEWANRASVVYSDISEV